MKIAIVTLHRVYNYGSVLQAYATQKVFEKRGHSTQVIDYITPQLYGSFENTGMPYADTLDWWAHVVRNKKVNLYLQDVLNGENKGKNVFGEIEDNPFFASLLAVGKYFKLPERAVLLLPSKVKSDSNAFDLSSKTLVEFKAIKKLSERYKCSAVFYDCPSGTQLLAEWSISESDNVVCCLRPTYQFIRGTVESVTSMSLTSANPKLPKKNFIICFNSANK